MKKMLFLLILLVCVELSWAQEPLTVNAGSDTNFCGSLELQNEFTPFHLNASVEGGTPPYEIEWTMLNPVFFDGQYWDEHHFLDSNSVLNPLVKTNMVLSNNVYHDAPVLKFALTATDSTGISVSDSVKVSSSYFTWSLSNLFKIIYQGDSAILFEPNIWGGIPPLKYHWEPSENMSDSTSITPTVLTLETVNYNVTITDAEGCSEVEFGSHNTIYVIPTGVDEPVVREGEDCIQVVERELLLKAGCEHSNEGFELNIFNISGAKVLRTDFERSIAISMLPSGAYVVRLSNSNHVYTKKIVLP